MITTIAKPTPTLDSLLGATVAVHTDDAWRVGVLRWGGKGGHRVVTADGLRVRSWNRLVVLAVRDA